MLRGWGLLSSTHLFSHWFSIWIFWSFYHVIVFTLHVNDYKVWEVPLPQTWRNPPLVTLCLDMHLNHFVTPCCNWNHMVKPYAIWVQFSLTSAQYYHWEISKVRSKQEHPGLCACSDTKLLFILHVTHFLEILVISGLNLAQIESGPMQTQQNLYQTFWFI